MPYRYKCTLVIGATSGIGAALADTILGETSGKVIGAGRRRERLDTWVDKHGSERVSGVTVDLTDLASLEGFANRIINAHPDLDCLVLNSGISNVLDFTKPETIDTAGIDTELTTNYVSYIHLLKYFLPHLQARKQPAGIVVLTSGLALVPIPSGPTYSASKAALHSLTMSLRSQLKEGGFEHIKVVEILPSLVQTDLQGTTGPHDMSHGMPLDEFTKQVWEGLSAGHDSIAVGQAKTWWDYTEERSQKAFHHFVDMLAGKGGTAPWEGAGP